MMAFKFKNPFKKKTDDFRDDFPENPPKEDEKIQMDGSNPFEESGKISFDDKDPRQGRKLKSKYVIGIACVVAALAVSAVASNLMAPNDLDKKPKKTETVTKADKDLMSGSGIPSNYAELAKFEDAERKKAEALAKQKEEKEKKEREEKLKKERERLEKERQERERNRVVQTPRVNVNRPSIGGGGSIAAVNGREQKALESPVAFGLGSGGGGGGVANIVSAVTGSSSHINMSSSHVIAAGTILPATLLSGLTSDGSTDVVAQVRQDVYDSLTGQHLLIPQGSKLLGSVAGTKNRRLAVKFQRVILPDGSSVKLPDQNSVDKSGYAGMKDRYDTHDATFFRSALISGVVSYLADEVDSKANRSSGTSSTYTNHSSHEENYQTALNDTVEKITDKIMDRADRDANRDPSISIRPGFQFNVFINTDLTIYEYLR